MKKIFSYLVKGLQMFLAILIWPLFCAVFYIILYFNPEIFDDND